MPQQTKTEALEELARLIRRDIMNGTARLNETWWFDDDTRMQDRIAHVLLDYSDDDELTKMHNLVSQLSMRVDELSDKNLALIGDRNDWRVKALALTPIQPAPVVKERGPWVVMREAVVGFHYYTAPTVDDWGTCPSEAKQFDSRLTADIIAAEATKDYASTWFVRTLAEAGGQ